jgi:multimeric flavodoxin WrbA/putative sterol carrier protein
MEKILQKIREADILIWSFPLYYFSVPGPLKTLIDRQLPHNLPFMTGEENGSHPARYDMSHQQQIVISTCGFYTSQGNYGAVDAMFSRHYGNFERLYCGQGELLRIPELRKRTGEWLKIVRKAGAEYPNITKETRNLLNTPLFPQEKFEQMADASWGIEPSGDATSQVEESLVFTKQMAALYNVSGYDKDRVFEMRYTDIGQSYQIALTRDKASVSVDHFTSPDTIIETPFSVWKAIAAGEMEGSAALAQKKYTVEGDFTLMLKWDDLFGSVQAHSPTSRFSKRGVWINRANISGAAMGIAFLISNANGWFVFALELAFALFWGITVFQALPLTCYFSAGKYGGERMLANPLFVKTNRIITACWSVGYLCMALVLILCTYLSVPARIASLASAILPLCLGIFTVAFQKWYPARMAMRSPKKKTPRK